MDAETLRSLLEIARRGNIFVATAGAEGLPHVAAAGRLDRAEDGCVAVTEWFCPGTLANLQVNSRVAIVAWDPTVDLGYQLLGEVTKVEDVGILDGYAPTAGGAENFPQVKRRLLVRVDAVLDFRQAPHTDKEV